MGRKITLCAVIAGLILIVAGVFTFMNGFHNIDSAFNFRTLEKILNKTLTEQAAWVLLSPETKTISVNQLYTYGITDIFRGMVAVFFGSLMFGYSIKNL